MLINPLSILESSRVSVIHSFDKGFGR
ncbi:hypothetical protein EMIT053CA3_20163 [Pseudomonas donghuensis]